MRISDYIEQSFSNLRKKKLRTFLTTFGVVIGIGALVSMISFGQGVQKNATDQFKELELFNYINVSQSSRGSRRDPDEEPLSDGEYSAPQPIAESSAILDDAFIHKVTQLKGVESAFPEIRFPALIRFKEKEQFTLVQVLPAYVCQSQLAKRLRAGKPYESDDSNSLVISDSMLRRMDIRNPQDVIGQQIEISSLTLDFNFFNLANIASSLLGGKDPNSKGTDKLPFSSRKYTFTIVGVAERMGFGGVGDVFIPQGPSKRMQKLSITSIWDFFQSPQQTMGYSSVSVRLASAKYLEPVKKQIQAWGFKTFAMLDQLDEMKKAFIFMDMFLFAVGMIAITVASLGIVNTMVMSVFERYREIGIMKAVGAADRDVRKIFFFESGMIGFLGGVFGFALGWAVSTVINHVINYYTAKQGVPYANYFIFPFWLLIGAVAFSIVVSLIAGVYPASRAAKVDPIVALRHD